MSEFKKTTFEIEHYFDSKTCRHYLNGFQISLHCHHYTTLYSQLAIDAGETQLLVDTAEETFYNVLKSYYDKHNIEFIDKKIDLACQYYSAVGMGKLEVIFAGKDSGEVVLHSSHIDSGWLKKWGKYDKPVNYITVGFINALFALINNKPVNSYQTKEEESIVKGAEKSVFKTVKK